MTDLIARAKDYLEKTKGITEGEWKTSIQPYCYNKKLKNLWINFQTEKQMTNLDYDAVNLTPTARALIAELVKEVKTLRYIIDSNNVYD